MKLLFITIGDIPSINHHEIYPDLLREFVRNGHDVYVLCSREKRHGLPTELIEEDGAKLLKVRIGNITKTNIVEKGISTVLIGYQYKAAVNKYFRNIRFDLIMYSTPPVTLAGVVEFIKKRDNAKTYLLLKDIFPQNAIDIGLMSKTGIKSFIYKYFRNQEKKLYAISDCIGCMSPANVRFILKHNPELSADKVEVCPNSIEIIDKIVDDKARIAIRNKYNIPLEKIVFVYGGNLGKPQGIPFLIKCLEKCKDMDVFFLIVGDGTEYGILEKYVISSKQRNVKLLNVLPKEDYEALVGACDVGMIFLDYRFTIPNFPSRVLSYMQANLPVLAVTDSNTDIGKIIVDGCFGWWCESNNVNNFIKVVKKIVLRSNDNKAYGENGNLYLKKNYSIERAYQIIISKYKGE